MTLFNNSIKDIKEKQAVFEAVFEELGRHFVNLLFAAFKVAGMYEANNNRYIDQSNKLRAIMQKIFDEESEFTVTAKGGYLFLSDVRLKADRDSEAAMTYFLERWPILGISGLSFSKNLDPRELDKFVFFMSGFEPGENRDENHNAIKERLNDLKIENVATVRYSQQEEDEMDEDRTRAIRVQARKTFFSALSLVQNTTAQARLNDSINIAKTKRVVQNLIDIIIEDESALLEMTALRNFDDYTYVHSVNVCVLSLILGYHIGLDRKRLSNLGVGALLHDIGKTKLPIDLVNKPDAFNDFDWELMRKHPVFGTKFLLKTRIVDETTARAASAVFEHHITFEGTGYPPLSSKRRPSLFARIVSITDTYNAMASDRVYHKKVTKPDEVITNMVNRAGTSFDPILLKVFINAIGIYPVGMVVALSSNQIGIVARNNADDLENPQVKVIGDENGLIPVEDVRVIDLSKEPGISVKKIIDGDEYKINNGNYLEIG